MESSRKQEIVPDSVSGVSSTKRTVYQPTSEKDVASGYAGLDGVGRVTKGMDTTDRIISDNYSSGFVLKDSLSPPHYWGLSITFGVLVVTDLGTTKP